jgi:hypothetical protein
MLSPLLMTVTLAPATPKPLSLPSSEPAAVSVEQPATPDPMTLAKFQWHEKQIVRGGWMLGWGIPMVLIGLGGEVLVRQDDPGGPGPFFLITSRATVVGGAVLTGVGAHRIVMGNRNRRALLQTYAFAPNRRTLGLGARVSF